MTDTLELKGLINADGKVIVEVPPGIKPGKYLVNLQPENTLNELAGEAWTEDELREAEKFKAKPLSEILKNDAIGSWENWGDIDSAEWVDQQRDQYRPGKK